MQWYHWSVKQQDKIERRWTRQGQEKKNTYNVHKTKEWTDWWLSSFLRGYTLGTHTQITIKRVSTHNFFQYFTSCKQNVTMKIDFWFQNPGTVAQHYNILGWSLACHLKKYCVMILWPKSIPNLQTVSNYNRKTSGSLMKWSTVIPCNYKMAYLSTTFSPTFLTPCTNFNMYPGTLSQTQITFVAMTQPNVKIKKKTKS